MENFHCTTIIREARLSRYFLGNCNIVTMMQNLKHPPFLQEGDVVVWKSLKVTSVKKEDEAYRRLQTTAATKAEKASARVEALFAAVQLGDLATSGIILGVARASPYASCVQCHKKMYIDGCGAVDDPQFSQELLSRPAQCQVCNHTGVPFLNFAALLLVEHGEDMTIR